MDDGVTELFEQEPKQGFALSRLPPNVLTGFLFVISSALLFGATLWLWELPFGNGSRQIVLSFFNGMLLSLPILLSIWAAFGAQTWIVRLPLTLGTLLVFLAIYLAAISSQRSSTPDRMYWLISAITLATALFIQIPLWIVRVSKQVRISRQVSNSPSNSQFAIKHLLIATTVIALLLPLLQWVAIFDNTGMMTGPMIRETVGFCGIFILVLAFLTLLSVLVVFLPKLRIWCWFLLMTGIIALPFAVVPSIKLVLSRRTYAATDMIDTGLNVMMFSASNALTMIVVLFMYYAIGFRLHSSV